MDFPVRYVSLPEVILVLGKHRALFSRVVTFAVVIEILNCYSKMIADGISPTVWTVGDLNHPE